MADPFTIRVFVPDGDPDGIRIIDRMNWTGLGLVFRRSEWADVRAREEMQRIGIYILVGYEEDDLPTLYIGQADGIKGRIDSHDKAKDFWNWAAVFVSNSGGLNRAHVTWLEYALIKRATDVKLCHLDNGNVPQEPALSEPEKADIQSFLNEVLRVLPLVNLHVFESPKVVSDVTSTETTSDTQLDTVVVPAYPSSVQETFLGEDCWYPIRIAGGKLDTIKFIAAYESAPTSAITYYADVSRIEQYGEDGKYKVFFAGKARKIGPIPFGNAPKGAMAGKTYTSIAQLKKAKTLADILSKT